MSRVIKPPFGGFGSVVNEFEDGSGQGMDRQQGFTKHACTVRGMSFQTKEAMKFGAQSSFFHLLQLLLTAGREHHDDSWVVLNQPIGKIGGSQIGFIFPKVRSENKRNI